MKSPTTSNRPKKKKPSFLKFLLIILPILLLAWLGYTLYQHFTTDYAYQAAKPLEDALIESGAVKKCQTGDPGRGPDNQNPWYEAHYQINSSRDSTIKSIDTIARAGGYTLTQASKENRGPLNGPDEDLGNWFFDTTHQSQYPKLKEGNVELVIGAFNRNETTHIGCGLASAEITSNENTSMIILRLKLPDYK